jgi:hypothetical protein
MDLTVLLNNVNPKTEFRLVGEAFPLKLCAHPTALNGQIEDKEGTVYGEISFEVLDGIPILYVWLAKDLGHDPTHRIEMVLE